MNQQRGFSPLPKCPSGKKCFRTPFEALPYMESLAATEHPVRAGTLGTYTCRQCGTIHIGHDFGKASLRTARRGKHARQRDRTA